MNTDRLLLLASRLEQIACTPVEKRERVFDLGTWWNTDTDCGTCACAIGEATAMPEFNKLGFRREVSHPSEAIVPTYRVGFDTWTGWDAACQFFQINEGQAEDLFCTYSYTMAERENPAAVAAKIRDLCTLASQAERV